MNDKILSQFSYNPETGILCKKGKPVGWPMTNGYISVYAYKANGKIRAALAHRVAWRLMTGKWPAYKVDHINNNRSDNKWVNLRLVDNSEHAHNAILSKNNLSGIKGVCWSKERQKWQVRLEVDGKTVLQKRYKDFFEACCARRSAEARYNHIF